jgi:hypothetical protein
LAAAQHLQPTFNKPKTLPSHNPLVLFDSFFVCKLIIINKVVFPNQNFIANFLLSSSKPAFCCRWQYFAVNGTASQSESNEWISVDRS